jgi:hypothetical protein
MDAKRFLPLSGIAFVALVVIPVFALGGEDAPTSDASAAEVMAFYDAHTVQQGVVSFLLAASAPFLVFFGASLAGSLSRTDAYRREVGERVLSGGSVLAAAAFLVTALAHFALADGADQGVSPTALQALNVLDNNTWIAFNSGLGVMMLGAAGCLIPRTRAYRRLGWMALVLGIALFIPFADFFALLLTGVWIIATSVILFRERSEAEAGFAAVAPTA